MDEPRPPKRTFRYRKMCGRFGTQRTWFIIPVLVTRQVALGKPHMFSEPLIFISKVEIIIATN